MGRRTSGQSVGQEKIGNVLADANTLTTSQANQNLVINPNGTGITQINRSVTIVGDNTSGGELRLADADGSHWTILRTAASTTTNRTITFPNTTGTANQILQTDGSGNLSWVAPTTAGVASSDPGASSTVHYPFFATSAGSPPSGQVTAFNAKSNLSFVPSTGELSSTIARFANVVGSASNSGTLTIRGTSSATKATASVLLTDGVAASSTTTGTLVVTGGVGVSGALHTGTLTAGTTDISGTATFTGGIRSSSSQVIRARYDSSDNYSANLGWSALQLGNNGNNDIVAGNTNTGGNFRFWVNSTTLATAGYTPNGTNCLTLASNGNATFSGTITENSSIAYKENVNPIMDALNKILMLNGVTYDRTEGSDNKNEAGLIAEEVYEVLPNLVQLKDGKPDGVCYNRLTAYLIEAVKTLSAEVEKLKK
jgi:hypothetical protein